MKRLSLFMTVFGVMNILSASDRGGKLPENFSFKDHSSLSDTTPRISIKKQLEIYDKQFPNANRQDIMSREDLIKQAETLSAAALKNKGKK